MLYCQCRRKGGLLILTKKIKKRFYSHTDEQSDKTPIKISCQHLKLWTKPMKHIDIRRRDAQHAIRDYVIELIKRSNEPIGSELFEMFREAVVKAALDQTNENISNAALIIGWSRPTLHKVLITAKQRSNEHDPNRI